MPVSEFLATTKLQPWPVALTTGMAVVSGLRTFYIGLLRPSTASFSDWYISDGKMHKTYA